MRFNTDNSQENVEVEQNGIMTEDNWTQLMVTNPSEAALLAAKALNYVAEYADRLAALVDTDENASTISVEVLLYTLIGSESLLDGRLVRAVSRFENEHKLGYPELNFGADDIQSMAEARQE